VPDEAGASSACSPIEATVPTTNKIANSAIVLRTRRRMLQSVVPAIPNAMFPGPVDLQESAFSILEHTD
jgi:hypothetical protein